MKEANNNNKTRFIPICCIKDDRVFSESVLLSAK